MSPEREALLSLVQDYKVCFSTQQGRAVLNDLVRRFGYTRRSTLAPGRPDESAYNEGQRSVLVHVGTMMDVNPATLPEDAQMAMFEDE